MAFEVNADAVIIRVELLDLPGVRATGFTLNETVGPLATTGRTEKESETVLDRPKLLRMIVELTELPATTLPEAGLASMVKFPMTVRDTLTECISVPLVPLSVIK